MHRQGSDPDNIQPGDILCDFCERPTWEMDIPSIEGHHGSVFCVECLEQAWDRLVVEKEEIPSDPEWKCCMCLESNDGPWWQSSLREAEYAGDASSNRLVYCTRARTGIGRSPAERTDC